MKNYLAEFIGSFFLILALALTGNLLASALLIIPVIYLGGQLSGAHFNPAVTIAFWAASGMPRNTFFGYVLAQFTGAFTGALLIYFLIGSAYYFTPNTSSTPFQYSSIEVLFAVLLCLTYLILFCTRYFKNNKIYGLVIGFTYAGILLIGEPISGGIMNPTAAIATSIVEFFEFGESYQYLPVYILAPAIGGLIAGNLFSYLFRSDQIPIEEA